MRQRRKNLSISDFLPLLELKSPRRAWAPGVRAQDKCTRVCKHFKLVFRYAAVDCTTAARIRGLLRLRLIVRRGRCPRVVSPLHSVASTFSRATTAFAILPSPGISNEPPSCALRSGNNSNPDSPSCTFDPTVDRSSCMVSSGLTSAHPDKNT